MMIHHVGRAQHTPALRATPLHKGDSSHAVGSSLYEEGCPKGGVCNAAAFRLIAFLCGLFLFSGCQTKPPSQLDQPMVARFFMEVRPGTPGTAVQLPVSRVVLNVNPQPVLVEYDIPDVNFAKVDLGS